MPRGGHRVKPAKEVQVEASVPLPILDVPFTATKPTRSNTDWRAGILKSAFLTRKTSEPKLADPVPIQPLPLRMSSRNWGTTANPQAGEPDLKVDFVHFSTDLELEEEYDATPTDLPNEIERLERPTISRTSSGQSLGEKGTFGSALNTFEDLTTEETHSAASSLYSRDSSSIFSKDSASIYSSASSLYSSEASIYSYDEYDLRELDRFSRKGSTDPIEEEDEDNLDCQLPGALQYQQSAGSASVRRLEPQEAKPRGKSSLAKKAALFKNSRLPPQLPSFSTSLPTWSMICRAAQASQACYDSQALTRRGTYIPAVTSKGIKAMIIDDQLIDNSRLVVVSVRGTQCQSFADWSVNKAAKPVKPVGFLDDEENTCHAGFLQVAKAMLGQVAAQLQQHPASSERPSLLFTGHSAGGAVAAMLYSHMLSTSVHSDLTALASQFSSINCVTFGSPPLSLTPLPRRDHGSGVFLAFANEGDPVLRLSNAAYVKTLAKLMTASPPSSAASAAGAPPVKVVRRSRGTAVVRKVVLAAAPVLPWEELPLWPTPPAQLTNAGDVILLRDGENGSATASRVTSEDLKDVIFADLAQHTIEMYIRRVKEMAFAALTGIM
jgi:hypothetical protein